MCGHGNWLSWLKANVPFSRQQANNYMNLAKLPVTGNLEDQWRVILGNAEQPDVGEQSAVTSEPAREESDHAREIAVHATRQMRSYFAFGGCLASHPGQRRRGARG
ncbi:MAG: DUF3102 domain-containing protein [Gemmata sp.]